MSETALCRRDGKLLHILHRILCRTTQTDFSLEMTTALEASDRAPGMNYISLRPSMAFSMVISSVYSMSLPTGMPMAMRVTFTPARLSCCER